MTEREARVERMEVDFILDEERVFQCVRQLNDEE